MYRRLLIATDGSELAAKAVTSGLALAKHLGAQVVVVTATEPWSSMSNGESLAFDFPIDEYEKAAAEQAERPRLVPTRKTWPLSAKRCTSAIFQLRGSSRQRRPGIAT